MGYTTEFTGAFRVSPPLSAAQVAYLKAFADTRRMRRNPDLAAALTDPIREAVGLPVGTDGAYFVGGTGFMGQGSDQSVVEYNDPPRGQPGLWCKWEPSDDGAMIQWNGVEKFYDYVEWLRYLVEHFLAPWGHVLDGTVEWEGEEQGDQGRIHAKSNVIRTQRAVVTFEDDPEATDAS